MSAVALSGGYRAESEYMEVAKRYSKDELKAHSEALALLVQSMEAHPYEDLLGQYYMEIGARSSQVDRGEFYTPPSVSKLMAKIVVSVEETIEKGLPVTVNEPAL